MDRIQSDRLFVCLLPLLEPQACVGIGEAPEFSFERLSLLAAPAVDARLNATGNRDAQVDAGCPRNDEQDKKQDP